jgi:L-amino acid N-acyltransferase YncA
MFWLETENVSIVTWMVQQEVGGRVNYVDSRGDVTYLHSFHQYTTLGKHSLPPRWRNKG